MLVLSPPLIELQNKLVDTYSVAKGYSGVGDLLKKVDDKLDDFLKYENDWDGEDALPLLPHIADRVKQLLTKASEIIILRGLAKDWRNPGVALLPDGGLDLDWEVNNRRLIFYLYSNDKVEYLRKVKRARIDDGLVANFEEIIDLILWVHNA